MINQKTLDFLLSLPGWCTKEKMEKLYALVIQCANEFANTKLISIDGGIFGGRSLFPMAIAHKDIQNGIACGIDAFDNVAPLEGTNEPENNEWWAKVDMQAIYKQFVQNCKRDEWSGYVEYLVGKTIDLAKNFDNGSITMYHMDGNHSSEVIIQELTVWSEKIKHGGYLVCDDINWPSTKAGYAKLPEYGFELVEQYDTWAIYKKTGGYKISIAPKESAELYNVTANIRVQTKIQLGDESPEYEKTDTPVINVAAKIELMGIVEKMNSNCSYLPIKGCEILPVLLFLPDTKEWVTRFRSGIDHFNKKGVHPFCVAGIHARAFGIQGFHKYMRDAWTFVKANYTAMPDVMPKELKQQKYNGDGRTGGYLSHYMLYNVMSALKNQYYMVLEDDCRFADGWQATLEQAMKDVPPDFDFLFVGSACAEDKEPVNIKGDIWHFPKRERKASWYPQTGYCYIVAAKALPILIATQRDTADQVDVSLIFEAFPYLNIYAVLPKLAHQTHEL